MESYCSKSKKKKKKLEMPSLLEGFFKVNSGFSLQNLEMSTLLVMLLEHLQQALQILVLFGVWTVHFTFYLPTFSYTLFNRFSIIFSIPFKYYLFILSLIFLFQSSFIHLILMRNFSEKCYVLNILQYFHNKSYVVSYYLF